MSESSRITELHGKRLLLGVTGSIAAYKAAELIRRLRKLGTDVQVLATQGASQFISPITLATLSGRSVLTDLFDGHNLRFLLRLAADARLRIREGTFSMWSRTWLRRYHAARSHAPAP